MKVLLVNNLAGDRQESMQRFGRMLAAGLPAEGIEAVTIAPQLRLARLARPYRYRGWPKLLGYVDKFVLFPGKLRRAIRQLDPDVVHIMDHGNSAYHLATAGRPALVTCHDLLQIRAARGEIPFHRPGWSGRRFQHWILRHLGAAPEVACTSGQTRAELIELTRRAPARTHLVPLGLNHPYAPVAPGESLPRLQALAPGDWHRSEAGFYLNVGGGQWYKNRPGLLRIFAALRKQTPSSPWLVMVGKPLSGEDAALALELGLGGRLLLLSNVGNEDLAALYSAARGLIFPSRMEGFGWPIAEALACGCPVFTTDRAPMTEVGGDAAVYLDPDRPDEAAARILGALPDAAGMRARGLVQAKRWTAPRMIRDYAQLYRRMAARPVPVSP